MKIWKYFIAVSLIYFFSCENIEDNPDRSELILTDMFGTWQQYHEASQHDTILDSLLIDTTLHRNETYILKNDFTYEILNPRMFANAGEGTFEVDIQNNRIDLIPNKTVPIVLNGDSVSIDLEIKPWYWEIVDLASDTLTIKEYERTGLLIIEGDTQVFVKTE